MTINKFKDRLIFYRDSFTDDIPEDVVHSSSAKTHDQKGWKVRKGWFTQLAFLFELALLDKLVTENLILKIKEDLTFIRSKDFNQRLTTKADITRLNKTINLILKALEQSS